MLQVFVVKSYIVSISCALEHPAEAIQAIILKLAFWYPRGRLVKLVNCVFFTFNSFQFYHPSKAIEDGFTFVGHQLPTSYYYIITCNFYVSFELGWLVELVTRGDHETVFDKFWGVEEATMSWNELVLEGS